MTSSRRDWYSLLASLAALGACGDEPVDSGPSGAGAASAASNASNANSSAVSSSATSGGGGTNYEPCANPVSEYPAAPYGNQVGDVFPLLSLQGYVNPDGEELATSAPFGPFTSDGMRTAGSSHVMLHLAATW
jgi:hypothetical protein